jgi:hypothetical protein
MHAQYVSKLAALEVLQTAFDRFLRSLQSSNPFDAPRAEGRLLDACLAHGMAFDEPSISDWAALKINALMAESV